MIVFYLALFFVVAVTADWLGVEWHEARDKLKLGRVVVLGAIIELINWAPLVVAIDSEVLSATAIACVNIAGSVVGAGAAIIKLRKQQAEEYCSCVCVDCGLPRR